MGEPQITVAKHESGLAQWEIARRGPMRDLRPYVLNYEGYWEASSGLLRRLEVPHGGVVLIISFGPSMFVIDPRDWGEPRRRRTTYVAGLHDRSVVTESAGTSHGIQVNLTPIGAYLLLGRPMHEITNRVVELDDLLGADAARLEERLFDAATWESRFAMLDSFLARRFARGEPSRAVMWACAQLRRSGGNAKISALAEEAGFSRKHLTGQFEEQVGLAPKTFARIIRFQRAVAMLSGNEAPNWSEVAFACGYYDQPHFNRDFREFTGMAPAAYLARQLPDGGGFADEPQDVLLASSPSQR